MPSLLARSHRASLVIPRHGPYAMFMSNCLSTSFLSSYSSERSGEPWEMTAGGWVMLDPKLDAADKWCFADDNDDLVGFLEMVPPFFCCLQKPFISPPLVDDAISLRLTSEKITNAKEIVNSPRGTCSYGESLSNHSLDTLVQLQTLRTYFQKFLPINCTLNHTTI